MARSLVCFMLMLGLMLVLSITTGANDSLAANNHALICHVINGCQPGVNATMCSISTKIEALVILSIVKFSWDLVAARSRHELRNALDWVRSCSTT